MFDYEANPSRRNVLSWLEESDIPFYPCGNFAKVNSMISYMGQICLDVPYDTSDSTYQKLEGYFENTDGTMKFSGVRFIYVKLEDALKNKHHDEPGFWEQWAENF